MQLARSNPDERTVAAGMEYSGRTVLPTIMAQDLTATARIIKVLFFVIQGKEDMATPTSVAVEYFNVVRAPKKKLILIEHAGHFALVTHREAFLAALVKNVRPLAMKSERH